MERGRRGIAGNSTNRQSCCLERSQSTHFGLRKYSLSGRDTYASTESPRKSESQLHMSLTEQHTTTEVFAAADHLAVYQPAEEL